MNTTRQDEADRRKQADHDLLSAFRGRDCTEAEKFSECETVTVKEFVQRFKRLPIESATYDADWLEAVAIEQFGPEPMLLTGGCQVLNRKSG